MWKAKSPCGAAARAVTIRLASGRKSSSRPPTTWYTPVWASWRTVAAGSGVARPSIGAMAANRSGRAAATSHVFDAP